MKRSKEAAAGSDTVRRGWSITGKLVASIVGSVVIAVAVGTSILSLWLKPYVTGSMARFYDWNHHG